MRACVGMAVVGKSGWREMLMGVERERPPRRGCAQGRHQLSSAAQRGCGAGPTCASSAGSEAASSMLASSKAEFSGAKTVPVHVPSAGWQAGGQGAGGLFAGIFQRLAGRSAPGKAEK